MQRTIMTAVAVAMLAVPASAQSAAPKGWASKVPQERCTAENGLRWLPAETWTKAGPDGKVVTKDSKARCVFDSRAAQAIIYRMLQAKQGAR